MRDQPFERIPASWALASCMLCGAGSLTELWSLPDYPMTEIFGPYDPDFPSLDQALMSCGACGHVQLGKQVDPGYLYSTDNYRFEPTLSEKYAKEYDALEAFIRRAAAGSNMRRIVEFGARDLSFAQRLSKLSQDVIVCDPLLPEVSEAGGFTMVRDTVEAAVVKGLLGFPSLIVARHTLEHIGDPVSLLAALLDSSDNDAVLVFEVPSYEHLLAKRRFDAITHQHVHYFSRLSMQSLAERLDARLLDWEFNPLGSNGGSLLFAISRSDRVTRPTSAEIPASLSSESLHVASKTAISGFQEQMAVVRESIDWDPRTTFGFGASLMLATLDYHLDGGVSELGVVFDDDPHRAGSSYRNVDVSVMSPGGAHFRPDGTFVVTSWENARSIYRRRSELHVGRIVSPWIS